jgi:glycosyltransferase involved in cell wall biosynthesis
MYSWQEGSRHAGNILLRQGREPLDHHEKNKLDFGEGEVASMPVVSVIIPTYGRAEFVNQAVASVLQQTFTDYEIIVVDDCSGDDVVAAYRLPSTATLITREVNSGSAALPRSDGFHVARGRYLAFLDSDDLWLPDMLAGQVALLDAHPEVGVAFCHFTLVDQALRPLAKQAQPKSIGTDALAEMIACCVIRTPSQALIRREALEAVGGLDLECPGTEDWELWLRLARTTRFATDPTPHILYRVHANQQSNGELLMRRGGILALEKQGQWIADHRPELLAHFHRHLSRRYYLFAEAQFAAGEPAPAIYRTLVTARAHRPASTRIYQAFGRLAAYALRQKLG